MSTMVAGLRRRMLHRDVMCEILLRSSQLILRLARLLLLCCLLLLYLLLGLLLSLLLRLLLSRSLLSVLLLLLLLGLLLLLSVLNPLLHMLERQELVRRQTADAVKIGVILHLHNLLRR